MFNGNNDNTPPDMYIKCHSVPDSAFSVGLDQSLPDKVIVYFENEDGEQFAYAFSKLGAAKLCDGITGCLELLVAEEDEEVPEDVTLH